MKSSIVEKLKKTTADLNTANKKLKDAEQKLSTFQKLKELKMTGPAVEQGVSDAQTEIDDLRVQVRDLLEQLAAKDDQLAMLKGRVEKLEADNKELREENASLKVQLKDRDEMFGTGIVTFLYLVFAVADFMVEHGGTVDESLDKKGEKVSDKELRTLAPPPSTKELEAIQKYCQIRGATSLEKNAQKRILYRIRKKIQKANKARTE